MILYLIYSVVYTRDMEINVRRQIEYNNYNIDVLELLGSEGLITTEQMNESKKALGVIQNTLREVKSVEKKYFKVIALK